MLYTKSEEYPYWKLFLDITITLYRYYKFSRWNDKIYFTTGSNGSNVYNYASHIDLIKVGACLLLSLLRFWSSFEYSLETLEALWAILFWSGEIHKQFDWKFIVVFNRNVTFFFLSFKVKFQNLRSMYETIDKLMFYHSHHESK